MCAQQRLRSAWASAQSDQSLHCPHWRKLGSLATHWAHSEDWSDWVDAQADLSLRWVHSHFVGFVMKRLKFIYIYNCWCKSVCHYVTKLIHLFEKFMQFEVYFYVNTINHTHYKKASTCACIKYHLPPHAYANKFSIWCSVCSESIATSPGRFCV